jgi:hypothetical protein
VYFDPCGVKFPPIPDDPTGEEIGEALTALKAPFVKYPFRLLEGETATEKCVAMSVVLAYIITVVNRAVWNRAPGFAFNGNNAGVGKTKIVESGSVLAIDEVPSVLKQGKSAEEFEKSLATVMLKGFNLIAIDNVERALEGDLLNQSLTADRIFIRLFGWLDGLTVPNVYTMTATGNGVTFVGDATRRWLQSNIISPAERPELEQFDFDPLMMTKENRSRMVTAVLTILKGWIKAGRPGKPAKLGSFEDWSDDVRGALMWLGEPDPAKSMEDIRANDPRRNQLDEFLSLWHEALYSRSTTVADAVNHAKRWEDEELSDLFKAISNDEGKINNRKIGWWLRKNADKPVNGRVLYKAGQDSKTKMETWAVKELVPTTKTTASNDWPEGCPF